ncbi:chitin synthase C [Paracoccidioides brasiliensis Pb18]|uniref:Chitin synthase n=1 Tax=Paracoccidioides brasiliensis (strain Pb18) TaxID=502780 RepID=A0A0A0HU35_PARBD|nr:chitin synthase C [Paracoccidioides brasiliensis Pb18]KGM91813.1 chitin synthase C [Paracoccidioides brasiliensis Pb18]
MCGGACGEIKAMLSHGKRLINPLVAAQNFEYKMSNILDKPLESAFGFISVLPGAFSAYRYVALQNDKNGQGPLEKYFAGEKMHGANAGIFTANMYLAEDRILCFELVAKRNCQWLLQYVKSSTGETDVPDRMAEFILQRRRWLNGSFFAAVYAITHFYQIFRSRHSFTRKFMFIIEFVYQTINMLFAWFAIGNFFLVFHILTKSLSAANLLGQVGRVLGVIFEWLYLVTLATSFILALGNRPQGSNKFYMTMVYFWIGIMIYLTFAAIYITVKSIQAETADNDFSFRSIFQNHQFFSMIVSLMSTYVHTVFPNQQKKPHAPRYVQQQRDGVAGRPQKIRHSLQQRYETPLRPVTAGAGSILGSFLLRWCPALIPRIEIDGGTADEGGGETPRDAHEEEAEDVVQEAWGAVYDTTVHC